MLRGLQAHRVRMERGRTPPLLMRSQRGNAVPKSLESVGVEPIMRPTSRLALGDEPRFDEHLHVMGERALAHIEVFEELAGAEFAFAPECAHDGESRLIGECAQGGDVGCDGRSCRMRRV